MKKILSILLLLSFFAKGQGPTLIKAKQLGDGLGTGSFVVTGGPNGSFTYQAISSLSIVPTSSLSLYQLKLNGTGFVVANGTVITYDNSTYITASSVANLTNKTGNISQWTNDAGYAINSAVITSLTAYIPYVGANSFTTSNNITAASFISTGQSTFNTLYIPSTATVNGAFKTVSTNTLGGNTVISGALFATGQGTFGTNIIVNETTEPQIITKINNSSTDQFILGGVAGTKYLYTADPTSSVVIYTNGVRRFTITKDGNVGIGFTTPASQTLTVVGDASVSAGVTTPSVFGSAVSGGTIGIFSTSHATKGLIQIGAATASVNVGGGTFGSSLLHALRVTRGTGTIDIGEYTSGRGAIWVNQNTPTSSNFALSADVSGNTFFNGPSSARIMVAGSIKATITANQVQFAVSGLNSATTPVYEFVNPDIGSRAASNEINFFKITGLTASNTWNTGALSLQRFVYLPANTLAFVGASTASEVYNLYVEKTTVGTNATITRNWALGTNGAASFSVGSSGTTPGFNPGSGCTASFESGTTNDVFFIQPDAVTGGLVWGAPSDQFGAQVRWGYTQNSLQLFTQTASGILEFGTGNSVMTMTLSGTALTYADALNDVYNTTTGTKHGTATTQKQSFWNATPIVQPANTVAIDDVLINTGLRASGGSANFTLKITNNLPQNLKGYTVATLPAGTLGDIAYVTDALAPTFLAAVVGGGTVKTPVFYDGTNWVSY